MWLYVPSKSLQSALESAGSISGSESLSQLLEQCCTSRGKRSLARYWKRGCETVAWMMHLFGQVSPYPNSMLDTGVERWISSLLACPASPTQTLASGKDMKTSGLSGLNSSDSWKPCDPPWSSLRTYQPSLDGFDLSEKRFQDWVTSLRQEYSVRPRSGHPISGSGGSAWPTATAQDGASSGASGYNSPGHHDGTTLTDSIRMWPTPTKLDAESTTRVNRSPSPGSAIRPILAGLAKVWGTPRVTTNGGIGHQREDDRARLEDQAFRFWHTPRAGAEKFGQPRQNDRYDLQAQACSLQDQETATDGNGSSPASQISRRLNPRFVERLQGLPKGWTSPYALIDLGPWVISARHLLRHLLSPSYGDESMPTEETA